tara:strand:+ start:44 stop:157 length:114 start_codon:yes stop_codon:yes gene_type:complete
MFTAAGQLAKKYLKCQLLLVVALVNSKLGDAPINIPF